MTYRTAGVVDELSPLEERALILADKLEKDKQKYPFHFIRNNERQIVEFLGKSGFIKTDKFEVDGERDTYFFRSNSVVLMRFSTGDSRLYVFPKGEEMLGLIQKSWSENTYEILWDDPFFKSYWEQQRRITYNEGFTKLCQQQVITDTTGTLLYIARST